ncbi:MAG TPA: hypothetical protein VNG13_04855 [Mycobacteriales bacterium]|nr:hypothetical protein [Mycobacteriales bacterium]
MSILPTATLGRTGVVVTKLGYGAMELRGGGGGFWGRPMLGEVEHPRCSR